MRRLSSMCWPHLNEMRARSPFHQEDSRRLSAAIRSRFLAGERPIRTDADRGQTAIRRPRYPRASAQPGLHPEIQDGPSVGPSVLREPGPPARPAPPEPPGEHLHSWEHVSDPGIPGGRAPEFADYLDPDESA